MLWDKVDYMAGLGLTPWYVDQCKGSLPCATCRIVPPNPTPQDCQDCTSCAEYEARSTQPVHATGLIERDLYAAVVREADPDVIDATGVRLTRAKCMEPSVHNTSCLCRSHHAAASKPTLRRQLPILVMSASGYGGIAMRPEACVPVGCQPRMLLAAAQLVRCTGNAAHASLHEVVAELS